MQDRNALDAARQIVGPRHRVDRIAADLGDRGQLIGGQILVPAKFLEHAHRYRRMAVFEFVADGIGVDSEQSIFRGITLDPLVVVDAFDGDAPIDTEIQAAFGN